jgi:crossover junction endodeoxyribonuclease RuvC
MIILGIDPGTATTGYGVIKVKKKGKKGKNFECLNYGCIETDCNDDFLKRLSALSKKLREITKEYQPDYVAVEQLFFFQNFKTAMKVSQAMGVIFLTLERMKVPVLEYAPLEVKKTLTKNGRAKKKEVENKVKKMLKLKEIKRDDSADALAVAICAAYKLGNKK